MGALHFLYDYNDTDHQNFVANWFESFSCIIPSDADSFFNKLYLQENIHSALCHAYARALEEIDAELDAVTKEILALLSEVHS